MSKSFLALSLWELLFLYYVMYYFSYQVRLFPWFSFMPDRWGESMTLIFFWILFFFFCIPVLFEIRTKKTKKKFEPLDNLIKEIRSFLMKEADE